MCNIGSVTVVVIVPQDIMCMYVFHHIVVIRKNNIKGLIKLTSTYKNLIMSFRIICPCVNKTGHDNFIKLPVGKSLF